MRRFEKCHSCGGEIRAESGPGRWQLYRGVRCEVPHDLAIDTCTQCGSRWLGRADVGRLSAAFEQQRRAARAGRSAAQTSTSAQHHVALVAPRPWRINGPARPTASGGVGLTNFVELSFAR